MKILALHDGHTATACYMRDGAIVSMVSEERFTGRKNQWGFPAESFKWILETNRLTPRDFDLIVFPHLISPIDFRKTYAAHYSPRHMLFHYLNLLLPRSVIGSRLLVRPYIGVFRRFREGVVRRYASSFGLDNQKIRIVEHHAAHGCAALFGSGFAQDEAAGPVLVFTLDGSGDGISGRVAAWDRVNGHTLLQEYPSFHSIGELFSRVTQFMGMRAGEHEYKLMGMAPYVPDERSERAFKKFLGYIGLDAGGRIVNRKYFGRAMIDVLRKDFLFERFDNIAAGLQRHYEHVVTGWVRHWARRTGIRQAVFGGGCFMNVKCNMLIADFAEFDRVFFCPGSGDESTAMGAAYHAAVEHGEKDIRPLDSLNRGPEFDDESIMQELRRSADLVEWERCEDIERRTAEMLRDGRIIGRFRGPAEWGARALGGRSILCRADDLKIIHRLNKSIKSRDFWMPFAASILEEDADRYIVNPRHRPGAFMTLAFQSTPEAQRDIAAGLHPFDHTCRPQLVSMTVSPEYYRLLVCFKELTGMSGLLNTSFNLHGSPMVGTPAQAVKTLVNSKLDCIAVENYLVRRRGG